MRSVRSGAVAAAIALAAFLAVAAPVAAACPGMGGPAQTQSTAGSSAGTSATPLAMATTPVAVAAATPSPTLPQPPAAPRSWEARAAAVLGRVGRALLGSLRSALAVFARTMALAPLRPV